MLLVTWLGFALPNIILRHEACSYHLQGALRLVPRAIAHVRPSRFLWLGSIAQKCSLGLNWKLASRVGADAINSLGLKVLCIEEEDETYVLQRLSRGS